MIKQVIVIRKDLKMRRGKEIAQGSHASIAFMTNRLRKTQTPKFSPAELEWINSGFTKIVLQVDSERELLDIYNSAVKQSLEVNLIKDAGKTEFNGVPTLTCLAIGPDYSKNIDIVTGALKLY